MKQELIELLCEKAFQYSQEPKFKLTSGTMSQYYINCRPVTLSPRGMYLVGHLVYGVIKDLDIKGVGGMTFGADPISVATAFAILAGMYPVWRVSRLAPSRLLKTV